MSEKPNPEAPDSYAVKVHSGSELTEADRAACLAILAAGAVNVQTASWELPRTKLMATVRRDNAIVGVGAIKRERPEYALEKAKLSGFDFDPNAPELGYVVDDSSAIHMTTKSILRARFFERLIWVILNMEDGRLWEIALTSVEI